MTEMPKPDHLARRGNVYYLRRRVPSDLLQHYAPKAQFMVSLRTSDFREAKRRVCLEAAKLEEQFDQARRFRDAPVREELSDAEVKRLTALYLHLRLDEDDEMRRDGLWFRDGLGPHDGINEADFAEIGKMLEEALPSSRHALARSDISVITADLDILLEDEGIKLPPDSEAYRKLALAILRADVQAIEAMLHRQAGTPVETPEMPPRRTVTRPPAAPSAGGLTIWGLWDLYRQERQLPDKTAADFKAQIRRFTEVNGDVPVSSISKAHVRAFKDAMLKMPARLDGPLLKLTVPEIIDRTAQDPTRKRLTPRTVNKKAIGSISAVLGYAVLNGYIEHNPAQTIRAIGATSYEPDRLPYSLEDLKTLFGSPVFVDGKRYEGGGGEAAKWLPLLALFTGARLEELGSLDTADVLLEHEVPHLFIHAGKGRSVKNRGSRRRVPLHPALIRLGFVAYVEARRKAKDAKLFPALKSDLAQQTAAFSKWWGRYTHGLGITDKKKVFHSFRHSVKRGLREAGVDPALNDALMGHSAKDVAGRYGLDEEGQGFSLQVLRDALARLSYPGLDLPV